MVGSTSGRLDARVTNALPSSPDPSARAFRLTIVVFFAYTALPPLLDILGGGRLPPGVYGIAVLPKTALGQVATQLLLVALLAVCAVAMYASRAAILRHNAVIATLVVMCALSLLFSYARGDASLSSLVSLVLNLTVGIAIWRMAVPLAELRIFGHVGAALALGSLIWGLVDDRAWMLGTVATVEQTKAFVGTGLLAGPYPHMNNLGMSVAMALPFASLISSRKLRRAEYGVMAAALLLSASRTSIIALGAALAGAVVISLVKGRVARRAAAVVGFGLATGMAVVLPWLVSDPHAFTSRGNIWLVARHAFLGSPIYGHGLGAFGGGSVLTADMGWIAGAAHNLVLHYAVVGGALGAMCIVALLSIACARSVALIDESLAPFVFVLIITVLAVTEMPFRLETAIGQGWIGLPALVAVACCPGRAKVPEQTSANALSLERRAARAERPPAEASLVVGGT